MWQNKVLAREKKMIKHLATILEDADNSDGLVGGDWDMDALVKRDGWIWIGEERRTNKLMIIVVV